MKVRPWEVPVCERQLFLDLEDASGRDNLTRTLHQPQKRGPVIEPEGSSLQIACSPSWVPEDRCFKIWLQEEGGMAYAESQDGLHWVRPTLRCREYGGSLENSLVSPLCGKQVVYDPPDADEKSGAIHLATLRRDGFMSLDADARGGSVTTDPFGLSSPWLYVNVDAGHGSRVVEVVDAEGSVVARSREVRGDQLRFPVQWEAGDLQDHLQRPIQLRFKLQNAAFYSYWFDSVAEDPPH